MLNRVLKNTQEKEKFKQDFSDGKIKSELLVDICNDQLKKSKYIKRYVDFWLKREDLFCLKMLIYIYADKALEEKFGKHDFTSNNDELYRNWVLEYGGKKFIMPLKKEVITNGDNQTEEDIKKIIEFDEYYNNFVFNYIKKIEKELPPELIGGYEKIKDIEINYNLSNSLRGEDSYSKNLHRYIVS